MAKRLRFHSSVPSDLSDAIAYYDRHAAGMSDRFRAAVDSRLDDIRNTPGLFPRAFPDADFQFARVRNFPYVILYRVQKKTIFVIGVFHSASDPANWRRRAGNSDPRTSRNE